MTLAVYLPFVFSVTLAAAAPRLARRLAPGAGAWLLAVAAGVAALACWWSLVLLVASLVDDWPSLAHGQPPLPVADWISVVAIGVLGWLGWRVARVARARARLRRALRDMPGEHVVIVRDERIIAFVAPGDPGRIVVSDGMLRALTAGQRRVLFAHERAHLDARHPGALGLVHLAAAANPLLGRVAPAVSFLCERHADERAAASVGDRAAAAAALATAALAGRRLGGPAVVPSCGFEQHHVVERVGALHAPASRPSRTLPAYAVAAVAATLTAAVLATAAFVDLTIRFVTH
jgi:beta-lactamase regulating signal transducer with metallopeptidase domain